MSERDIEELYINKLNDLTIETTSLALIKNIGDNFRDAMAKEGYYIPMQCERFYELYGALMNKVKLHDMRSKK